MTETLVHPLTGVVLEDPSLDELRVVEREVDAYLDQEYRRLGRLSLARNEVRQARAAAQGPLKVPRPQYRTLKQDAYVKCPSCGSKVAA